MNLQEPFIDIVQYSKSYQDGFFNQWCSLGGRNFAGDDSQEDVKHRKPHALNNQEEPLEVTTVHGWSTTCCCGTCTKSSSPQGSGCIIDMLGIGLPRCINTATLLRSRPPKHIVLYNTAYHTASHLPSSQVGPVQIPLKTMKNQHTKDFQSQLYGPFTFSLDLSMHPFKGSDFYDWQYSRALLQPIFDGGYL